MSMILVFENLKCLV